ncbi:type II toxin-antitoxin system HicA family toxin [Hanamia caeni]|uniref:Type II toxin-antitoxin system HicA family toxin n=1 Tax=Hanamia caeni TaxID=2294116 RepID=A0A3M9NG37_9BACT|nr:type II toxin-antitoxin system HicA family toxin [Hanamia caeni]
MGKLKVLSGKQVCKILSQNGFILVHQKGSHIIMQKKTANSTITVPVPNHKAIRIGTLQSIIRQSGILRSNFEL